jgi:beta-aspartyl-peptidase (threonine type)
MMMWAIILHGGAKTIEADDRSANRQGCLAALQAGAAILSDGGSALDAAEAAVLALEDDPTFNAGIGSVLNADGEIETCAAMMEGHSFNVGAVAAARDIRNPVSAARAMLFEEPILIAGPAATEFARGHGLQLATQDELKAGGAKARSHDTVGCIALDTEGNLAAAVSTGGVEDKPPGRIGDSPQPGCGFYCDNAVGAVVFSGDGEHIARMSSAARVMHLLDQSSPDLAICEAISKVASIGGEAGGIAINAAGQFGWAHNSSNFAVAFCSSNVPRPAVYLSKEESHG